MDCKPKIIVVLGPTASGKSALAVRLAKELNGEIISADSRQVYKGLDIGTGKITKKEMLGIPHHLLDVADPKKVFTVQNFKDLAEEAIDKIISKGKLPIVCGGTGFYIQAIVENFIYPEVPPNQKLRKQLSKKTTSELFMMLAKKDVRRAANIDGKNKVRLIRALEIVEALGRIPTLDIGCPKYDVLQIGIKTDEKTLKEKIYKRLIFRLKQGMLKEAEKLHTKGLSWKRMEELGLEYRYLARFLQKHYKNPLDYARGKQEMIEQLNKEIWHYAKRQMTWFKRDKNIHWISL